MRARHFALIVALALPAGWARAEAGAPGLPSAPALTTYRGTPWVVTVVPKSAPAGTPRMIAVSGATCFTNLTADESTPGVLALRASTQANCYGSTVPTVYASAAPSAAGSVRVTLQFPPGGEVIAETTMLTTNALPGRSSANLSGMWYDPASNGSGIAFHHQSATDAILGTWFIYGVGPSNSYSSFTRWYSLQGLRWLDAGTSMEGMVLETSSLSGGCTRSNDCPLRAESVGAAGVVRITITSANTMRAEAFDLFGKSLFVSNLTRLVM